MKSHIKNTSSGSQFPIWFSERAKIQGILTSLEKSQLYDLETKNHEGLLSKRTANRLQNPGKPFTQRCLPGCRSTTWGSVTQLLFMDRATAGLTSKDICLVHEVSAENRHAIRFSVFQEVPDNVTRTRIHACSRLIQQQNLWAKVEAFVKPYPCARCSLRNPI